MSTKQILTCPLCLFQSRNQNAFLLNTDVCVTCAGIIVGAYKLSNKLVSKRKQKHEEEEQELTDEYTASDQELNCYEDRSFLMETTCTL